MAHQIIPMNHLTDHIGREIGVSDWICVPQPLVDKFAELCGDNQWIHTDPDRAASESSFGGTIVHGYMILSFAPRLMDEVFQISNAHMGVNRGFNKLRFISPLKTGDMLRLRVSLLNTEESEQYCETVFKLTFEGKSYQKPVCVGELVKRWYKIIINQS
ncbi:MAG: MaoC family dehydratase [Desulfobacterales bacterium]|nr:MaoC family dehydratase [Desulfobacterales bacterium]